MTLAVVLTTFRSPVWLEKVLWGYLNQTHRDFEIVIADDGSGDNTARVIRAAAKSAMAKANGITVQHVWQKDRGFRKSRILNKAIGAAEADYIVFSDGDCIPRSDFLSVHAALAARGRFLSGGYVKLPMATSLAITRDDIESGRAFSVRWLRHPARIDRAAEAEAPRAAASEAPDSSMPEALRSSSPRPVRPSLRNLFKPAVPSALAPTADLLTTAGLPCL